MVDNSVFCLTGSPFKIPEDKFEDNFNEAKNMMNDEANRTRAGFQGGGMEGPAGQPGQQQYQMPAGHATAPGYTSQQQVPQGSYGPDPGFVMGGGGQRMAARRPAEEPGCPEYSSDGAADSTHVR